MSWDILQGDGLIPVVGLLGILLNSWSELGGIISVDSVAQAVNLADLSVQAVGPARHNPNEPRAEWLVWLERLERCASLWALRWVD